MGDLPCRGFVKPLIDEKLNRSINNLEMPLLHKNRVFYLSGNSFCGTHFFCYNLKFLLKLNRTQIFADPPAMWGTSGQVFTDNNIIFYFKNLDNLCPKKEISILSSYDRIWPLFWPSARSYLIARSSFSCQYFSSKQKNLTDDNALWTKA